MHFPHHPKATKIPFDSTFHIFFRGVSMLEFGTFSKKLLLDANLNARLRLGAATRLAALASTDLMSLSQLQVQRILKIAAYEKALLCATSEQGLRSLTFAGILDAREADWSSVIAHTIQEFPLCQKIQIKI